MATVLFVVKATIRKDQEEAFNRWYSEDMAVYELESEANFRALMASPHMTELRDEYDRRFGAVSARARFAYEQVWP